ncbi:MAG: hypothetical protein N2327_01065 [Caldimicrobium sp.]|nr:hypothetical protein [Caldimicrobium sp.]MCX7873011.1 hypothetical protein [Caldimicrobium sp.]MDW8093524.1 hypothetical protein [Caldimicrobium sp.]
MSDTLREILDLLGKGKKLKEEAYRELLNLLQKDFPLVKEPFKVLGEKVGLKEEEVLEFLRALQEKGVLRHLGASPDSLALGHFTCLCACKIPQEKLSQMEAIADLPEVTHAYLRDHELNFWFTVVLPKEEDLAPFIKRLEEQYQIKIWTFPAIKKFKVRAVFDI